MTDASEATRAMPMRDAFTEPFWAAAREHRLLAPCSASGELLWPPRHPVGNSGGADVEWVELSGNGVVFTYSVVQRSSHAYPPAPYVLAIVELEEGITMLTNVVGVEPDEVEIGMAVQVTFERIDDETWLPVFEPGSS